MVPKLLKGFDIDLKNLLIEFEKESNVSFSVFANIWKKMKFTLIFSGRSPKELVHFTNEALAYTKSFLLRSSSFLRNICCIYIMYGIYYKQPIKNSSKISITFNEWIFIQEFINILKANKHMEPLYIISKLIFDDAFQFTALNAKRLTPIQHIRINYDTEIRDEEISAENLKIDTLLTQLESIEKVYEIAKAKVSTKLNIPEIKYADDNISATLNNILREDLSKGESKPGTSKSSPECEKNFLLRKRQSLKQKSFQNKEKSGFLNRLNLKTKSNLDSSGSSVEEEEEDDMDL